MAGRRSARKRAASLSRATIRYSIAHTLRSRPRLPAAGASDLAIHAGACPCLCRERDIRAASRLCWAPGLAVAYALSGRWWTVCRADGEAQEQRTVERVAHRRLNRGGSPSRDPWQVVVWMRRPKPPGEP